LTVSVDIEHSFIGDLRVSLASPGGSTVILHNRAGGRADNLVTSYTSDDVSGLADLIGEQAQGNWTLAVADFARIDVGTLRRWSLEMDLESSTQTVQGEAAPGLSIRDNDPTGVVSDIDIPLSGQATGIKVSVDITHTFIGDLRVELVAPSGQSALLHNQIGGNADNLIKTYDSLVNGELATFLGESIQGSWRLRVADLVGQDLGKLNSWRLELTA
jgi:subtilisin-like proprotein convertase family protein